MTTMVSPDGHDAIEKILARPLRPGRGEPGDVVVVDVDVAVSVRLHAAPTC